MNQIKLLFSLFAFFLLSLSSAQYVVTVTHHEIVTVTYNPVGSGPGVGPNDTAAGVNEQGFLDYSNASNGTGIENDKDKENENENELTQDEVEEDGIDGKIHAHQTRTKSKSLNTASMTRTTKPTGKSGEGNSAAGVQASLSIAAIALVAMLGGMVL